ncbi:hypothetical protein K435DRAFT_866714 [Dendrothele bispora CBS 962.96]|uniref:Uncharacterized protein n=1 Tax=Dendrothele bispora (strain CBS 962.96) TaxID=1314807 RepID=A0A4S8LGR5_DENBC|nr:hypothetical protein K435DRAFT_866714 [Dendrothele bispora CBS 962.96]
MKSFVSLIPSDRISNNDERKDYTHGEGSNDFSSEFRYAHIEPLFTELSPSIEATDICHDSSILDDIKRPADAHYCCFCPQSPSGSPLSLLRKAELSTIPNIEDTVSRLMNRIIKLYNNLSEKLTPFFLSPTAWTSPSPSIIEAFRDWGYYSGMELMPTGAHTLGRTSSRFITMSKLPR